MWLWSQVYTGPVTAEPSVSSHEDNNNESSFLVSKENVRKQKQNMVTRYFFNNKEVLSRVQHKINMFTNDVAATGEVICGQFDSP